MELEVLSYETKDYSPKVKAEISVRFENGLIVNGIKEIQGEKRTVYAFPATKHWDKVAQAWEEENGKAKFFPIVEIEDKEMFFRFSNALEEALKRYNVERGVAAQDSHPMPMPEYSSAVARNDGLPF